jgi:hypothetical protein
MRNARVLLACLILALAGLVAVCALFGAPPADAALPANSGAALAAQWANALQTPAGARFELAGAPAAWADWLNGRIVDPDQAALLGFFVCADAHEIRLTARLRGILLVPTQLAIGLSARPAPDGPHFACTYLAVGRLRLPAGLYPWLSVQLNDAWRRWLGNWQLDQIEWSAERIRVAGRRH